MDKDYLTNLLSIKDFIIQGAEIVNGSNDNYAVIAVDISNFKYLNDMYGMEGGDEAIVIIANYMFINNPHCVLACRTVGDQFRALLRLDDRSVEEEVNIIIDMGMQLEKILADAFPKVYMHLYVGFYAIDRTNFNMRVAIDKAHFAKKQIKGNFQIRCNLYKDEEFKDFTQQMNMVRIFEKACIEDGVRVFFQPKFDYEANRIIGAEALCRLVDEDGNYISPAHFIPILERNGMLSRLDAIMMEKTLEYMSEWKAQGRLTFPVSMNLSRTNFFNHSLVEQIVQLQKKYDIPTEFIELEITETTFIEDMKMIYTSITKLRDQGFKISVDDFGSGYSSLSLLTSLPADIIKLDRQFARQSLDSKKGERIVESIISMLKSVDFDIICEGIETDYEAQLVKNMGCSNIQGYLYDKPLPKEEFEKKYVYV